MTNVAGLVQRHSDNRLLAHIVWATMERSPVLAPRADAWLAAVLERKAREANCLLVAAGNASDHVHVLVRYPSTVPLARLIQRLKGASSHAWNAAQREPPLRWQAGSWAVSVSPAHMIAAARYVEHQRQHHATAALREPWERG